MFLLSTKTTRRARTLLWAGALVALCASEATAQTYEVFPSAGVAATATTNRDFLEEQDERGQVYSTVDAAIGGQVRDDDAAGFLEYRLLYSQPLATFGTNEDASDEVEVDHTVTLGGTFLLTDRLELKTGLTGFLGRNTIRLVQPFTVANPGDDVVGRSSSQIVRERNLYVIVGAEAGLGYALTEKDTLTPKVFTQWRRDFEDKTNAVGDDGIAVESEPQRDSLTYGLRLTYGHAFSETLASTVEVGYTRYLAELSPDSTGYNVLFGLRKGITDRLSISGAAGALALFPDKDDPTLTEAAGESGERVVALQANASLHAIFETWQASVGYGRDATTNGPFGNTLIVDAARVDLYYFWDDDFLLRGNVVGLISRPAFDRPGQSDLEESNQALSAGAAAVFRIVDWLALDVSYSFYRQFPLAEVGEEEIAGNLTARGDITVHTVLVGLSARTTLTPVGPNEPALAGQR